jgi:hypothetical protein
MKAQTIAVTIAFVAGFAIQLLTQSPSVISMGYFVYLSNFSGNVIAYWTGMLSSLPGMFAVIAIVATAWKAGLRNSILTGLGAVAAAFGVSLALIYGTIAFTAAYYPKKELAFADAGEIRNSAVKGASDSCVQKQKALPQSKNLPAAAIDAYCLCFGSAWADVATTADVASIALRQTTPSLIAKIKTASEKCMHLVQRQP